MYDACPEIYISFDVCDLKTNKQILGTALEIRLQEV